MKKAIITGITGQDGAYLAEHLLAKGYQVFGAHRHISTPNFWRIKELGIDKHTNFKLVEFDLTDFSSIVRLLNQIEPDEIYNLAAQSFVASSFTQPIMTTEINAIGALNILEAIRVVNPKVKYYQASTSEMYGKVQAIPQTETTHFYPRSPYGVSKLYAHWATVNYRESYGLFATSGILFNHESPLRGIEFVTRKITDAVAKIKLGKQSHLELGNIDAKRDWGHARDYVEGMHLMLQHHTPDTFVLSTGETFQVRHFVELSFKAAGIDVAFEGSGVDEVAKDKKTGNVVMKVNPQFYRPAEVDILVGSPQKAYDTLGWKAKTTLDELCSGMVEADIRRNSN